MNKSIVQAFIPWGIITCLVTGCQPVAEMVRSGNIPTVDLSEGSTEKSNLINYCGCITSIYRQNDEGDHLLWSRNYENANFLLSPGKYRVMVRVHGPTHSDYQPIPVHRFSFNFDARPGQKLGAHNSICGLGVFAKLFLVYPRCPLDAADATFVWLKDETTGEILEEKSHGYD